MNQILNFSQEQSFVFVQLQVDEQTFEEIKKMIQEKNNQIQKRELKAVDLLKRIAPFFMNKFKLWLDDQSELTALSKILNEVLFKKRKNRKQIKFELGDLVYLFSKKASNQEKIREIQNYLINFLHHNAKQCVDCNGRIQPHIKQYYKDSIQIILNEALSTKEKKFVKFLSKQNSINFYNNNPIQIAESIGDSYEQFESTPQIFNKFINSNSQILE